MTYRDCTAALIPAHNDAYTLRLCLAALAGPACATGPAGATAHGGATAHVDEVIVLDDCSTDETSDVVLDNVSNFENLRLIRHEGLQLGWVCARRELLRACTARHVFMLDADDVLSDLHAGMLRNIAAHGDSAPWVRLQLCELFGDLRHSTLRFHHYDACHVYVDRRWAPDMTWDNADRPGGLPAGSHALGSAGPLFFHLKDVKPDARLVERSFFRKWLAAGRAAGNSSDFAGLDRMTAAVAHRRAVEFLTTSKIDHPVRAWDDDGGPLPLHERAPELPGLLRAAPQRFRFVYDSAGHIVDRTDDEALL